MMHRTTLGLVAAITALLLVVAACGDDGGAPSVASADLDRGAEVYAQSCASCHGTDLRGTERGPSHLSIVYEPNHHTDDAFRSAIANGAAQHHWNFGPMPAIAGLSADDVESVIAYVRAQQQEQGFER
jgi:mono/diheme cytochrome c family protein